VGPEFSYPADCPRHAAQVVKTYYDHQTVPAIGSALLALRHPTEDRTAYVVVNGLDCTVESGSSFIAKYSLLALMQSLFEAGDGALARPVARLPRVVIRAPTAATELIEPSAIDLRWECLWTRWDARPYTGTTTMNTGETEANLVYALLCSADGGRTWRYIVDDSAAIPGERPRHAGVLVADQQTGPEVYHWETPEAAVPAGSYLIRVEAYRQGEELHVAHHTEKIFVDRR